MNDALFLYNNSDNVGCIHAWNYSFTKTNNKFNTYFLPGGDCWGWGTWKNSWQLFEKSSFLLLCKLILNRKVYRFNRNNTESNIDLLINNILGNNDSWAIRWHASLVLNDKFCLYPSHSLVYNTGFDGSGINCLNSKVEQIIYDFPVNLKKINVEDTPWYYEKFKNSKGELKKYNLMIKIMKYSFIYLKKLLIKY